jgi:methylaspartate mutase sigma subunit
MDKNTVVMGVIGSDIHIVGNKIIDYALREAGYNVVNLGIFNSHEDYINAAKETNAVVIVVSSLYGHGELDCRGLKEKCVEAGLDDILLYVGGNLMVGKQDVTEVEAKFKAMGFDRVAGPQAMPDDLIGWLEEDLGSGRIEIRRE